MPRPQTIHSSSIIVNGASRVIDSKIVDKQEGLEWELTFDSISDPIAIIDKDYHIVKANQAMASKLGVSTQDCVGKICCEHVHHTNAPPPSCPHSASLKDGKVHTTEVTEEETLGGCFEITTTPIKNSEGIVYGSVHIMHDVTEAKHTELQLLDLNKKLELLSSITRHDILNQLLVLSGNIEFLKASESREETDRRIAKMQHAVDVIRRQIEFAKDYERLGKSDPAWQDIEAIVNSVVSRKDMGEIKINCESLGLEVLADQMLEKVFYNLLDNSLRHGGKVSTIHVVCEARVEDAAIVYEDDGVGILPDEKEKIFQKGFGKNTGLGLFLSREILAITGITIIENGIRGVGSRFELFVPAAKARWK